MYGSFLSILELFHLIFKLFKFSPKTLRFNNDVLSRLNELV